MTEERLKYLLLKYLQNNCSRNELEEFFLSINQAKNDDELRGLIKQVYDEIKRDHPSLTYVDSEGNLFFNEPQLNYPLEKRPVAIWKKRIKPLAIAATLLALVVTFSLWQSRGVKKNQIVNVQSLTKKFTERKEQKFLLLPDSTQVWLNSASSLQFPDDFKTDKREVYLTGEAYFDVKHADKIPFLIHTGKVITTVTGTAFNIKAYPDQNDITISVTRGEVKVSNSNQLVATLTKGQIVKINRTTEKALQKNIPVETITAWQEGNLIYDEMLLKDVIKDLQNVYNVRIEIRDSAAADLNITTSFSRDIGPEQSLKILSVLTNKKLENINGIFVLK
ncbi:MAG: FecR domain-containing protein [Ferruginibacter sp.]